MFKVGVIGFGKIGKLRSKILQKHPEIELDSICDVDISETSFPCPFFVDYRNVLERKPNIVFVCTSNNELAQIVIDSLENGSNVFAEKPPGRNPDETRKMIAAETRNSHLKLKFGFNHRYHDSIITAKKLVESGRLGNVLSVRGVYGKSGSSDFQNEWRNQRNISGGGILLDQGIHMLDLMLLFCDSFNEVKSFVDKVFWDIDVEDNVFAILRNKRRQMGMLISSATQWKHTFHMDITLEEGYLILKGILSGTRSYGNESLTIARKTYHNENLGNPQEEIYFFDEDFSWEREIDEFVHCVKNDLPVQVGKSSDALRVMNLTYDIYKADQSWWENNGSTS